MFLTYCIVWKSHFPIGMEGEVGQVAGTHHRQPFPPIEYPPNLQMIIHLRNFEELRRLEASKKLYVGNKLLLKILA